MLSILLALVPQTDTDLGTSSLAALHTPASYAVDYVGITLIGAEALAFRADHRIGFERATTLKEVRPHFDKVREALLQRPPSKDLVRQGHLTVRERWAIADNLDYYSEVALPSPEFGRARLVTSNLAVTRSFSNAVVQLSVKKAVSELNHGVDCLFLPIPNVPEHRASWLEGSWSSEDSPTGDVIYRRKLPGGEYQVVMESATGLPRSCSYVGKTVAESSWFAFAPITEGSPQLWLSEALYLNLPSKSSKSILVRHHRITQVNFVLPPERFVMEVPTGSHLFDFRTPSTQCLKLDRGEDIPSDLTDHVKLR